VLVVEGGPVIRNQLRMVLAKNGYVVHEAVDKVVAINRMASFGRLDLIVTNVNF
jgi:CheY-like chemotaxis protein